MKYKKKLIGSLIIFVIFVIFLVVGYYISKPAKNIASNDIFTENTEVANNETKKISVYINGEVKKPGVYTLESGSRIEDAVKICGGFTENADKTRLNLAKKIKDEDYIFVDTKSDKNSSTVSSSGSNNKNENIVNINTASKEELMTLPGVGDVTSQKILDYREKNGDFSKIDDLKKVGGIGDKTLEKFKDKIEAR